MNRISKENKRRRCSIYDHTRWWDLKLWWNISGDKTILITFVRFQRQVERSRGVDCENGEGTILIMVIYSRENWPLPPAKKIWECRLAMLTNLFYPLCWLFCSHVIDFFPAISVKKSTEGDKKYLSTL
jgi:hypothetical protein